MKKNTLLMTAALLMLVSLFGCRKEEDETSHTARVNMHLTDAPADYNAVYINIQQVELKMESGKTHVLTPDRAGLYNVLDFRNGMDTLLMSAMVPVGRINQIRLLLGGGNYVVANGIMYPLNTPSAEESGLKINMQTELTGNTAHDFWLDFDAGKSIHQTGSGKYELKPVMRAYMAHTNGRITGQVLPASALATVYARRGNETATAIPGPDGRFMISGLAEGKYEVVVEPSVLSFASFSTTVDVSAGAMVSIGNISLH